MSTTPVKLLTMSEAAAAIGEPLSNFFRAIHAGRIRADYEAGRLVLFTADRLGELRTAMSAKVVPCCKACGSEKPVRNGKCPVCAASFAQRQGQQPVAKLRAAPAAGPCAKCGNTAPPTINPRVCRACGAPR